MLNSPLVAETMLRQPVPRHVQPAGPPTSYSTHLDEGECQHLKMRIATRIRNGNGYVLFTVAAYPLLIILFFFFLFDSLYKHVFGILKVHNHCNDVEVHLRLTPELDRQCYNLPTSNEVAVILPGTAASEPRDIVIRHRAMGLFIASATCIQRIPLSNTPSCFQGEKTVGIQK